MACAVDLRGFEDGGRQRHEVLPQQEGAEGGAQSGQDDAPEGVLAAHPGDEDVVGQDGHLRRHHQGDKDQHEDGVLERETHKYQGVGGEDGQQHFDGGAHQRDDGAVKEELREGHRGHGDVVVLQVHALREDFQVHGDDLAGLLERAQDHPEQRQEDHQGSQDQRDVAAGNGLDNVGAGQWPVRAHE
ncbi:hypothetical protein D9M72_455970 [compost metagenome]